MHHFPISIQLVSKQIRDHDHLGMHQWRYLLERPLIAFDHRILVTGFPRQAGAAAKLRRHAGQQVGARFVGQNRLSAFRNRMGNQIGGSGLSIRPRHQNDLDSLRYFLQDS